MQKNAFGTHPQRFCLNHNTYIVYTPAEQINIWLVNNYNRTDEDSISYVIPGLSIKDLGFFFCFV